jgi:hypothetical protein
MTMDAEKSWNERNKEKKHSHKSIMYNDMVLVMTLAPYPDWRVMFSVLLFVVPLVQLYVAVAVAVLYLMESSWWLLSKGKMSEARMVQPVPLDGQVSMLVNAGQSR